MVTLKEIAKKSGVSYTAASFVVNGKWPGLVNRKAAAKVKKVLKDFNYISNSHARRLVTRKTETIGILTSSGNPVPIDPFYSRVFTGIVLELQKAGYDFALSPVDNKNRPLSLVLPELKHKGVDGILSIGGFSSKKAEKYASDAKIPVIILVGYYAHSENSAEISVDDFGGAYQAVKYLIGLGHTRIGFFSYENPADPFRKRYQGYLKALQDSGIKPDKRLAVIQANCNNVYKAGYYFAEIILNQKTLPTAIFCANDITAVSAMQKFREKGLAIPKDISIIGFDDIILAGVEIPSLTTVHVDIEEIGRTGVRQLIDFIEGRTERIEKETVMPTKLIIRESCGKPKRG